MINQAKVKENVLKRMIENPLENQKDVAGDDQENQDDQYSHYQELIKKQYSQEMFQRHLKTML